MTFLTRRPPQLIVQLLLLLLLLLLLDGIDSPRGGRAGPGVGPDVPRGGVFGPGRRVRVPPQAAAGEPPLVAIVAAVVVVQTEGAHGDPQPGLGLRIVVVPVVVFAGIMIVIIQIIPRRRPFRRGLVSMRVVRVHVPKSRRF